MIEVWAERISIKLKEANPEETTSVEVMKFALIGILQNTITISTALVIGGILGHLQEVFIAVCYSLLLRLVSGGFHFKSALNCFLFSAALFIVIPFIPMNDIAIVTLLSLSLVIAFIFAPSNVKAHLRVNEKYYPVFKLISMLIIATGFFFWDPIITLALFAQSLTLITLRRGGESDG